MTAYSELAGRYLILIEGGPPSNYSAWSPDLPGCVAVGQTLEEAERATSMYNVSLTACPARRK